jgi:hypothetical protein
MMHPQKQKGGEMTSKEKCILQRKAILEMVGDVEMGSGMLMWDPTRKCPEKSMSVQQNLLRQYEFRFGSNLKRRSDDGMGEIQLTGLPNVDGSIGKCQRRERVSE